MSARSEQSHCAQAELVPLYVLNALPSGETHLLEAHLPDCPECRRALQSLSPVMDSFISWPTEMLRPSQSMWSQIQHRIAEEPGRESAFAESLPWQEPQWVDVAPGISCKLLATDTERDRVSMLVRLAPGAAYPPHRHADVEELFLLYGELWIEDRKLYAGDYNRREPGTADSRVWSETGCTCILITSFSDVIS
ncbi:MAG: cupin domain-containing protein [Steroidobacteraceae bacterium]